MVSSKDAKEVGNREHHTHSGICVASQLRFAAEEWRVFISFPNRLGKKFLDSGFCTLADSELIPDASNILETFDLSLTCFSHINREVNFIYQVTAIK